MHPFMMLSNDNCWHLRENISNKKETVEENRLSDCHFQRLIYTSLYDRVVCHVKLKQLF